MIIRIQNLTGNDYQTNYYSGNLPQKYEVNNGDILISWSASLGVYKWASDSAWLNQHIYKVVFDKAAVNKNYFMHQVRRILNTSVTLAHGSTMTHLTRSAFNDLPFIFPNIEVQIRQARILDEIDKQITLLNYQICVLDSLIKSRFVEMFGTIENSDNAQSIKICPLSTIARVGSSHRVFKDELTTEGIPFYRGTEIALLSQKHPFKPTLFISPERYESLISESGKPQIGDLLMPSICPDGQIWMVDSNHPFYFKDGRVLWVRPDQKKVDSLYLLNALKMQFQTDFKNIASGTTFAELKIFILKEMAIPLPSLECQKQFADFVRKVDKLKFI